ncbi:type II toxin-antitoxin system RelE/ParE family toxin [Atopobium fossor]|uniref:type II toxin-antitoxin system RelE/ParE family toxin n=1 Tax=Atopobium fossor TaxID=39487 RepID=UPI00040434C7|nr:type II toxin-antitoxin system RelE/ParE family toxin [Atopobium fossor]
MWDVRLDYITGWLDKQDELTVAYILAALELLQQKGPALGRPLVDTLKGTKIKNLKELRPISLGNTEVRIIFAFDVERNAIMLFGGDKSSGKNKKVKWSGWYKNAIPEAERLYWEHLKRLGGKK